MKKLIVLICMVLCNTIASAQQFTIYSVSGSITVKDGKRTLTLAPSDVLTPKNVITIPKGGKLILLNTSSKEQFTFTKDGTSALSDMLKVARKTSLPEATFRYLIRQLTAREAPLDGGGVIYRGGVIDSLSTDTVPECK